MSDTKRIIGECVGEASLQWDPKPVGTFDSGGASALVDRTVAEIDGRTQELEAQCAAKREALVELSKAHGVAHNPYVAGLVEEALATDAGKAMLEELACLRAALGFLPLSIREAIRLADVTKCEEWAAKANALMAQLQERAQKAEAALNEVDDDMSRDRDRWKEKAEKAERERDRYQAMASWDRPKVRTEALTEMRERCAKAMEKANYKTGAEILRALTLEET